MSGKKFKKPEKGAKPKQITTKKKPGSTGPGGANPARNRYKNQTTDSNNG